MAAAPLILGRYRPLDTLGQGSGGTVELCWDTRIQRRVAIKRLPLDGASPDGNVPGLSEARTGAMLNHPCIVSVYDFDVHGSEAFLIMEAIEGPSLRTLIKDTPAGEFDLDIVTSISTAVANALTFAHKNQVLHLDVKPDNILTTVNGTAKVSDFGISQLAGTGGFGSAVGGTIGYMPPEQMRGEKLDERCDEFAFAVVIYEMLTGKNPFRSKTIDGSLKAIEHKKPAGPSTLRDDVDPGADAVLFTALSPDREERYDSIADFYNELLPYLGDAKEGIAKLGGVVTGADEDAGATQKLDLGRTSVLAGSKTRVRDIAGRALAAALCWWVSVMGLDAFPSLVGMLPALIGLLPALAGFAKPVFGALLAVGILAVGLIANPVGSLGSFPLAETQILGIVVLAALVFWFSSVGRAELARSRCADVNCTLSVVPLGLVSFTPLAPLLTGLCLPVKRAAPSALLSAILAVMLAAATGTGSLLSFEPSIVSSGSQMYFVSTLSDPSTWIVVLGWILATVSAAALCSRGTRVSSLFGILIAACLLLAAQVIAQWAVTGTWLAPETPWLVSVGLAAVVAIAVAMIGAPRSTEGEV